MIVLDTCSAINCFNISSNWLDRLKKCCANKKIIWSTTTNKELIGLSRSTKSLESLIERLNEADNVDDIDIDDLPERDYLAYLGYLSDISKNDSDLFFEQFPSRRTNLATLQASGKNRLSDEDKELIGLSKLLNATLATDDKRILKILDKFYTSQPYICTPKIIQKIRNITTVQQLRNLCSKKGVYIYPNYHNNIATVC